MKFSLTHFLITVLLFLIEVVIAVFISDAIIRPFVGDFLVVILIYCAVKSFFNTDLYATLIGVLLFSYLIEALQYFQFVYLIGLGGSTFARTVIGTSFAWMDILMYTLGVLFIFLLKRRGWLTDKILKSGSRS
jgi:hypothetical protein